MKKSGLFDALNAKKFDKRLIDWNLEQGIITEQDLKSYTSELADDTSNKVELNLKDDSHKDSSEEEAH
ncbi:MAG: hypothetical protein MK008_01220 [Bdellovibrionales bacterium]|nr:hypothetical protein [Bdellovibrionales bacterium]